MKPLLISILFLFSLQVMSQKQSAVNFTCVDCKGDIHDLFTELDAGKVIVLCWVMPCGPCVPLSLTTYNVVGSYASSNPGKVFFYLVDDYANTDCLSINSWANSNGLAASSFSERFSNAAIDMTHYGAAGMPKIVVLGGQSHSVFYNANTSVDANALVAAIDLALAAAPVENIASVENYTKIFPNPADKFTRIFLSKKIRDIQNIDLYSMTGNLFMTLSQERITAGENFIELNTSQIPEGAYLVKISSAKDYYSEVIIITHN